MNSSTPNAGTLTFFYTTDGSDPRRVGGAVSPKARSHSSPVPARERTGPIQARTFMGGEWSTMAILK